MNTKQSKGNKSLLGGSFIHLTPKGLKYTVGTVCKNDCKSVYVELKCWLTTSITVNDLIKLFKKRLRSKQYHLTHGTFGAELKAYFTSFDYAETKFHAKAGGTTYFNLEVTLMADDTFDWKSNDFQVKLKNYGLDIYRILEDVEVDFILTEYK